MNIHTYCLFEFICKIRASSENNCPTVGKKCLISRKRAFQAVLKREKGVWSETTRHLFTDEMGGFCYSLCLFNDMRFTFMNIEALSGWLAGETAAIQRVPTIVI